MIYQMAGAIANLQMMNIVTDFLKTEKKLGIGILYYQGSRFEGEFYNDLRHGKGIEYY